MTIHDVDWTLPMTLDLISETQRFDVMPVDGPKVHVIMLKDDGPNAVELWKGMLRVDQMVDVLNWMQFMRILAEGEDDECVDEEGNCGTCGGEGGRCLSTCPNSEKVK